jgi:hypothetical protein
MSATLAILEFNAEQTRASHTLPNGRVLVYELYKDMYFREETPLAVREVLADANLRHTRLRLHLGVTDDTNPSFGEDWMEENDVAGYIGVSAGPLKVPILLNNYHSRAGGHILDHCIVKITTSTKGKKVLYQHPNYHRPQIEIKEVPAEDSLREDGYTHHVLFDEHLAANFKSLKQAQLFAKKME